MGMGSGLSLALQIFAPPIEKLVQWRLYLSPLVGRPVKNWSSERQSSGQLRWEYNRWVAAWGDFDRWENCSCLKRVKLEGSGALCKLFSYQGLLALSIALNRGFKRQGLMSPDTRPGWKWMEISIRSVRSVLLNDINQSLQTYRLIQERLCAGCLADFSQIDFRTGGEHDHRDLGCDGIIVKKIQ